MTAPLDLTRWLLDDEPARWSAAFVTKLAAGRDVPTYGTPEWTAAPWELQVAAAVRAGEYWRREGLCLAQRLADELAARRAAAQTEVDYDDALRFADLAQRVVAFDVLARRAAWLAKEPTHAELVERRAS